MTKKEDRTLTTGVEAVVRRADGSTKQVLRQVDDVTGDGVVVLEDRKLTQKKGGFLGNARDVLLVGSPLGYRAGTMRDHAPYRLPASRSQGMLPLLARSDVRLIARFLAAGIMTKDGLGDAAKLLVSSLTAPAAFGSIAVGTDATLAAASTNICLGVEVPSGDASGMTRRSGGQVTGSLTGTLGGHNGNGATAQWQTTFSSSGTIGVNEVGLLNSTSVPHQTTISDNPLTSGAAAIDVASTSGFAAAPNDLWCTDGTGTSTGANPEAVKNTGTLTSTQFPTVSRGQYGTSAAQHAQNTKIMEILGDLALRQVFASVLNLINTDTLQLTLQVQNS